MSPLDAPAKHRHDYRIIVDEEPTSHAEPGPDGQAIQVHMLMRTMRCECGVEQVQRRTADNWARLPGLIHLRDHRQHEPVLVAKFEHGSPEWHAARAAGIGGSEIGAIVGVSPWESRFSLWHRKRGEVDPQPQNAQMEWGKRLEAPILAKFAEEHPELTPKPDGTYHHPDRPWQIANPDRWYDGLVVDAKYSMYGDGWGEPGTDQVPPHVDAQVRWYMDVLGVDRAILAVLVGGSDYREYVVEYDPREIRWLVEAGQQFMDDLAQNRRPNIDSHSETYTAIREMHPDIAAGVEVELTNPTAHRMIRAHHALKAAEAEAQHARSLVADEMGDAHKAMWDGQKVADRRARGQGKPYVQIASQLPEIPDTESEAA